MKKPLISSIRYVSDTRTNDGIFTNDNINYFVPLLIYFIVYNNLVSRFCFGRQDWKKSAVNNIKKINFFRLNNQCRTRLSEIPSPRYFYCRRLESLVDIGEDLRVLIALPKSFIRGLKLPRKICIEKIVS